MYNDEWEPVMTADSMEEKVEEFAALAKKKAENSEKSVEDIVHSLTHESYLMKHTTSDILKELQELEEAYTDEFYNGAANDHIMQYLDEGQDFEFWYDYTALSLAAGLEWAILEELKQQPAQD
ncbi:hypothetical protein SAMN05443574_103258 [Haloarcula vallismortis]|uniref:Uncharacterized protein n=2 Tax=Haloarcula vallismortis TaxID=28442 RepID=M0JRH4_HALVA|nr:hypothetical protein [Haloarcula vallismortis]EMA11556.1 hypothetical protein C437_01550 [Haloarcula vallismortis ATCC 29715]SDW44466.1 hypothetical protein SAMN05443574_103258 [Haloarcula vallismortis]